LLLHLFELTINQGELELRNFKGDVRTTPVHSVERVQRFHRTQPDDIVAFGGEECFESLAESLVVFNEQEFHFGSPYARRQLPGVITDKYVVQHLHVESRG
jgi:hypothetical protein